MKKLGILGSTGSIGVSTLELVSAHPDKFDVVALSAGNNLALLKKQIEEFAPRIVAVGSEKLAAELREMLPVSRPDIYFGVPGLIAAATADEAEMVVAAIVGVAGLVPTVAAINAGKDVALANKETLVSAGRLIMEMVAAKGVRLFPVDSEHSAIFQSLQGHRGEDVRQIILTASGGPFLHYPLQELAGVSVADALNHPKWNMGRKISIDSATMMNKGLEVIEARWLFDMPADKIAVNIHPQSIVHSMVAYVDGCVMAQLGVPDMKAPIAYALAYPQRIMTGVPHLDLTAFDGLTFHQPDPKRFPALQLAYQALEAGESMPAVLNAANEVAVEAFLEGKIGFTDITMVVKRTMDLHEVRSFGTVEDVLLTDTWSRAEAHTIVDTLAIN